jgi:hypothetical protein
MWRARCYSTISSRIERLKEHDMGRRIAAAALAAATCLATAAVAAPPPGQGGAFTFRFGGFFPTGTSDFWEYQETYYTFDHSDLNGLIGGVGYNAPITNYFEFDANADLYWSAVRSADGYYVDEFGYPPLHDSRLRTFPVTVGFRVLPAGRYARRGTEGSHYVRRPVFYFGGGIGMNYWQYEEEGDFVVPDPIFPGDALIVYDRFVDTGLAFQTYAMIGMEFPVAPRWNVTVEVRQSWCEANSGSSFPSTALGPGNPNQLDLGGTSVFVGGSLRF